MNLLLIIAITGLVNGCKEPGENLNPPVPPPLLTNEVDFWLTKSDETVKLQKQTVVLGFGTAPNQYVNIEVDDASAFQTVDGF